MTSHNSEITIVKMEVSTIGWERTRTALVNELELAAPPQHATRRNLILLAKT